MIAERTVDAYGYCPRHGVPVLPEHACVACVADRPPIDPSRRLNVGCGLWPLLYFTNLDESAQAIADVIVHVPPLPYDAGGLDEIYAGHFLEHLTPDEAEAFLADCYRCLVREGRIGIVVPDTRAIMGRWLSADPGDFVEYPAGVFHPVADLTTICELFLYSTVQESPHRWSYDLDTLGATLQRAGFALTAPINRYHDHRIPVGAWYQCGWDAVKR